MPRLVSQQTKRLDLGNGEWIEVRENVSYADLEPIMEKVDMVNNPMSSVRMLVPLLKLVVTGWNILNADGQPEPFSSEKVEQFDARTILELAPQVTALYFPQKKSSDQSNG